MAKKKKNIRFRTILFFLLFGYLVIMCAYYIYKLPIKNIYITGNSLVSDQDIIDAANLKSYPSIHKYSRRKIAKNIKQLDLINDVKVKKNIFGKITIIVDEAKPIFYYRTDDKVYLSNGKSIIDNQMYYGIPIVINYVPDKVLNDLIKRFSSLQDSIISEISEIEYDPDEKDGTILDENRFLFRMNDTNSVYIDTINLAKLNNYQKIVAALDSNLHGYIYLNSNRANASFKAYEDKKKEEKKKQSSDDNEN